MKKRYWVLQRCDSRKGWEDISYHDRKMQAERAMKEYPFKSYTLRITRMPKGFKPKCT